MEPPLDVGLKICSNDPHLTKMASRPIYGKNLKECRSLEPRLMPLKLGIQHRVLKYYQICSNDDTGLT